MIARPPPSPARLPQPCPRCGDTGVAPSRGGGVDACRPCAQRAELDWIIHVARAGHEAA